MTFAQNTAVQETTELTPFELVFGRRITTPLDDMLLVNDRTTRSDCTMLMTSSRKLRKLNSSHGNASTASRVSSPASRTVANKTYNTTPATTCGCGHQSVTVPSDKLLRQYFGPYKVVRHIIDVNCEVVPQSVDSSWNRQQPCFEIAHVVRMKPYYAHK